MLPEVAIGTDGTVNSPNQAFLQVAPPPGRKSYPMTRVFLVRHAESVANAAGIYQGQTYDTPLSGLGQRQAAALAARFAGQQFDRIFTSPLVRTRQTASAVGPVVEQPALMETNHGQWEGLPKSAIADRWPEVYASWQSTPGQTEFPGGEHFTATANRAHAWLQSLLSNPGVYMAVTHTNVIQALVTRVLGQDLNQIWDYAIQPTGVTLIESNSPPKIIYINDTAHLNGLESDLTTHAL